jgi:hypothetical protein
MQAASRWMVLFTALGLTACGGDSGDDGPAPPKLFAPCSSPAPVNGLHSASDAPYVVTLHMDGANGQEESARLGEKYGFKVDSAWLYGFEARLDPVTVGLLSCEAQVESIQYDDGTFGSI